jgi:hypothetical protein
VIGTPAVDRGHNDVIMIKFSAKHCCRCPVRTRCTRAKRRSITLRPRDRFRDLARDPVTEGAVEHRAKSNRRTGVEGLISQGMRAFGLRRSRWIWEAKAHLQQVATATAMRTAGIGDWPAEWPREVTRTSAFTRLMAAANASCEIREQYGKVGSAVYSAARVPMLSPKNRHGERKTLRPRSSGSTDLGSMSLIRSRVAAVHS